MSTFRIHKTKDFTVMSNVHLREHDMSLKAKGLLTLMLSLPDDWDYSIQGLSKLNKDGKDSVMATLDELQTFGYLNMVTCRDDRGRYVTTYDVFENPNREIQCGKSESVNPLQYNTNILNDYISSPINSPTNNNLNKNINTKIVEEESTSTKEIISYWNTRTQNVFSSIRDVVGKRKIELNARIKEIGIQEFYRAIDIALSSDFLRGNNDRGWKMDFDWFVNKSNLNKILEGKYQVTRTSNGNTTSIEHMSIGQKWGQWLDQQGYKRI